MRGSYCREKGTGCKFLRSLGLIPSRGTIGPVVRVEREGRICAVLYLEKRTSSQSTQLGQVRCKRRRTKKVPEGRGDAQGLQEALVGEIQDGVRALKT